MKPWGAIRATVAVLAGAGLVWGATETTGAADTTRRSDVQAAAVDTTSGRVTRMALACAGADVDGSVEAASIPQGWASNAPGGGSVRVDGSTSGDLALAHGGVATTRLPSGSDGLVTAQGGLATGLVAGQLQLDRRSTARGLMLSNCTTPVRSGWFFGGGTQDGRVARLTLVNPAATPTTVDAEVVGSDGVDASASVEGTVLAPGERRVLTLGDFGSGLDAAAVHVRATGAGVVSSLTDVWMTGETPVGESTSSVPAAPAKKIVIPGVSVAAADPVLRLAVPGHEQAIVRVRATRNTGEVVADRVETVSGDTAAAFTLPELDAGDYTVQVTADVPVVASVMSRTATSGTTDLTWVDAAPELSGPAGVALPSGVPGASASVMLASDRKVTVDVVTVSSSGDRHTRSVVVQADRPAVRGIGDARAVWVRPARGGHVHAAVTISGHDSSGGYLASVPLQPVTLHQATSRLVPARG